MYARSLRQREQIHGRVFHTCTWPAQPRRARTVLHTQRCSMMVPQSHHAAIKVHANAQNPTHSLRPDNTRAARSAHRLGRDKHEQRSRCYHRTRIQTTRARAQQGSDAPSSAHGTSPSSVAPSRVKVRSGSSTRPWIIQIQIQIRKTCDPGKGLRTRAKRSTVK